MIYIFNSFKTKLKMNKPPKKDFLNHTHEYARDFAKVITLGVANPLVDYILPSFHQKKFEEWCLEVFVKIKELEETKISKIKLSENLEFISLLKESMIIASKTHLDEKLNIIKESLLNSIEKDLNFDYKLSFTRLIDSLSLTHLRTLFILNKNISTIELIDNYQEILEIINKNDKVILSLDELIIILEDLKSFNLINISLEIIKPEYVYKKFKLILENNDSSSKPYIKITTYASKYIDYIFN